MKLTAHTAGLVLILLLLEARETMGRSYTLCLDLKLRTQTLPGQATFEAQGSINGFVFVKLDSNKLKASPLGRLGNLVKNTNAWNKMTEFLEQVQEKLKLFLSYLNLEDLVIFSIPTLQAKLCNQRERSRCTGASWEFSIGGQAAFINLMSMAWSSADPGGRYLMEVWENNKDLSDYFLTVSNKNCDEVFQEYMQPWQRALDAPDPQSYDSESGTYNSASDSSDSEGSYDSESSSSSLTVWINPVMYLSCVQIHIFS